MNVSEMLGKTLLGVEEIRGHEVNLDSIIFHCGDDTSYKMWHENDCCERVEIKEVVGDWSALIGHPLLMCEESNKEDDDGTERWTFYRFATIKGSVTVDWYGESNGYYSMAVYFGLIGADGYVRL